VGLFFDAFGVGTEATEAAAGSVSVASAAAMLTTFDGVSVACPESVGTVTDRVAACRSAEPRRSDLLAESRSRSGSSPAGGAAAPASSSPAGSLSAEVSSADSDESLPSAPSFDSFLRLAESVDDEDAFFDEEPLVEDELDGSA